MSAPAPAYEDLTGLNQQIVRALADVRAARTACVRSGTARNVEVRERAQVHLDALLDLHSATRHRRPPRPPSTAAGVAVRT